MLQRLKTFGMIVIHTEACTYCTSSIGKNPSLGDVFLTFLLLILRWVIGSGAAIGALDEGLLYMKEVSNGDERRGKE